MHDDPTPSEITTRPFICIGPSFRMQVFPDPETGHPLVQLFVDELPVALVQEISFEASTDQFLPRARVRLARIGSRVEEQDRSIEKLRAIPWLELVVVDAG